MTELNHHTLTHEKSRPKAMVWKFKWVTYCQIDALQLPGTCSKRCLHRGWNFKMASKFRILYHPGPVREWHDGPSVERLDTVRGFGRFLLWISDQMYRAYLTTYFFPFSSSLDGRAMVNFLINLRNFKSHYAMGKVTRKRKNFPWLKNWLWEKW